MKHFQNAYKRKTSIFLKVVLRKSSIKSFVEIKIFFFFIINFYSTIHFYDFLGSLYHNISNQSLLHHTVIDITDI